MRLKVITLFLALQLLSFGIWKTVSGSQTVLAAPTTTSVAVIHSAAEIKPIGLNFAIRNFDGSPNASVDPLEERILAVLNKLPAGHTQSVKNIVLDYDKTAHRGLGGNSLIILRAVDMSPEELVGVLVHEIGHNVDYGYLKPSMTTQPSNFKDGSTPVDQTDPSLGFYHIDWLNDTKMTKSAGNLDFVSGYAMTDPFEDFAETYAYYVLHGNDFRTLTATSPALYAKYLFMKNKVFNGEEFNTDDGKVEANNRPWDVTLISYDLQKFIGG